MKTTLELVLTTHSDAVLEIDEPSHIPSVGDYVDRTNSGWRGTVINRWFTYHEGKRLTVRCTLKALL